MHSSQVQVEQPPGACTPEPCNSPAWWGIRECWAQLPSFLLLGWRPEHQGKGSFCNLL